MLQRIWDGTKSFFSSPKRVESTFNIFSILYEMYYDDAPTRPPIEIQYNFENDVERKDHEIVMIQEAQRRSLEQKEEKQEPNYLGLANSVQSSPTDDASKQCKICMDNERNVMIVDCRHFLVCAPCARQLTNCPTCRKQITKFMVVIDS